MQDALVIVAPNGARKQKSDASLIVHIRYHAGLGKQPLTKTYLLTIYHVYKHTLFKVSGGRDHL